MDISAEIAAIESASRGEAVRDAMISALNKLNSGNPGVPAPAASDSGKYLRVDSSGAYVLTTVPNAEGVSF